MFSISAIYYLLIDYSLILYHLTHFPTHLT